VAREAYVRTVDVETGDETDDGPFLTEVAAMAFAESRAEAYFGGDDVTWFEPISNGAFDVGRISKDGSRSEPLVRITVEDREVELMDDLGTS
jgi:hypothetical protein